MLRVVADDRIPFLKGVLEPFAEVKYLPGRLIDRNSLNGYNALIIRTRTKCTESLLKGTGIRFIGTATIGFDHIDTRYCDQNGIRWVNAPGCNSSSVQQYIASALLKMALEFKFSLKDKTIGIIGVGNVGTKVEKLARALGMNVLLNDPPRAREEGEAGFYDINRVISEADILTFHVPLNVVGQDKTYHLIDEKLIKKMKRGAWIINSSRGEVADTHSLKKALVSGKSGGAVIDVWEHEPDFDQELMHNTFIATPHIAGYSTDGKANGTSMMVKSLSDFFGIPLGNWYPEEVPGPESPNLEINCKGKSIDDILREAVFNSYDIATDDLNLRFSPGDFEKQRGDYRIRREFPAFTLKLKNGNKGIKKVLKELGFQIEGD